MGKPKGGRPSEGGSSGGRGSHQYLWACWTLNNPVEKELHDLRGPLHPKLLWMAWAKEVGGQGTQHLQGLMRARKKMTTSSFRGLLGGRAHVEQMRGTPEQAWAYFAKPETKGKPAYLEYWESGPRPASREKGSQTSLDLWKETVDYAKRGLLEHIRPNHLVQYFGALQKIQTTFSKPPPDLPFDQVNNVWLHGETGTGKSRLARELGIDYNKPEGSWWDGYDTTWLNPGVLFDDFDKREKDWVRMIKVSADIYSFRAPVKGAYLNIRPWGVVITSNYHPSQIWDTDMDLQPILRRFAVFEVKSYTEVIGGVTASSWDTVKADWQSRERAQPPPPPPLIIKEVEHSLSSGYVPETDDESGTQEIIDLTEADQDQQDYDNWRAYVHARIGARPPTPSRQKRSREAVDDDEEEIEDEY